MQLSVNIARSEINRSKKSNSSIKASLQTSNVTLQERNAHPLEVTYQAKSLNQKSINSKTLRVIAPELGFEQTATRVKTSFHKNHTVAKVIYQIQPPGGIWDSLDNAKYNVYLQERSIKSSIRQPSVKGRKPALKKLGSFQVNVPDLIPPTAKLVKADSPKIGSTSYEFAIAYDDNAAIKTSTLDNSDVVVTGTNGFSQKATFVTLNSPTNGKPRTATYRIDAPGDTWDQADSGTYTIVLQPKQVTDTSGNPAAKSILGSFQVSIDTTAPSASLMANSLSSDGDSTYDFVVTYSDNRAVKVSTLDNNDVLVTGANGFSQKATFVRLNLSGDGTSRAATYRIAAPGGIWDQADDGTYTVLQAANQVTDLVGNARPAGSLGTFRVALTPTSLNGTNSADTLSGSSGIDLMQGFGGNDTLRGNGGNDILSGGTGNDTLEGGDGIDTVSYAASTNGVTVNLSAGIATRIARIMPLGDSITLGITRTGAGAPEERAVKGGYRTVLWEKTVQNGLAIDFVGTESFGPNNLGDKNHQARGGRTIDDIDSLVNDFLNSTKPDIVLLMAGTNNLFTNDTATQMVNKLSGLIDKITASSPDIKVLVASIPPIQNIHEDDSSAAQGDLQRARDYNNAIPGMVNGKKGAGKLVEFVDMRSLTVDDLSPRSIDSGVHPSDQGYNKIGNFWFDALNSKVGISQSTYIADRDTLLNVENITGSASNDTLIGNAGANVIDGADGDDFLRGNGGADTFVYKRPGDGGDTIADFGSDDLVRISAAGFGNGLVGGISLSASAAATGMFVNGSNPISNRSTFLYRNGILSFDADGTGSGGQMKLAMLSGSPSLSISQIRIVS